MAHQLVRLVVGSTLVLGCAGEDRPPIIDVTDMGAAGMGGEGNQGSSQGATGTPTATSTGGGPIEFTATEMYVVVELGEGADNQLGVVQLSQPAFYAGGFPSVLDHTTLSVREGSIYYIINFDPVLYRFQPDLLTNLPLDLAKFPADPTENDLRITTPPCDLEEDGEGPETTVASPEGRLLYLCAGDGWYEVDGGAERVLGNEAISALGYSERALIGRSTQVNLANGNRTTSSPALGGALRAARATASGFRVVVLDPETEINRLWSLAPDGAATLEGEYPLASEFVNSAPAIGAALDRSGALYEVTGSQVLKVTVAGDGEIVFDSNRNEPSFRGVASVFSGP